jgi:amidase
MMTADLMKLDATAQAALIRQMKVSPAEMVDAAIACIERLNPTINAVITPLFEQARQQTRLDHATNGPFGGVPLLLKDYLCQTVGDPYYAGMQYLRNLGWRSKSDTFLAQKFRQAGFIFLGKTNLPELAGGPSTEPPAFGPTCNPWDITRSAGGSSGGSAAAVASGMVAVAHGNDGWGSVRIPASCCGLVGLKPSRGRISLGPGNSGGLLGNVVEFVLVRSIRDAAGILDAIAGPMPGDLFVAPESGSYQAQLHQQPGPLRVGLLVQDLFLSEPVHSDCCEAVERSGRFLESLGHHVEYNHPPAFEGPTGLGLALRMISTSQLAATLDAWSQTTQQPITAQDVEPGTWAAAEEGRTYTAVQIHAAYQRLLTGIGRAGEWWAQGFDLLVTPTMTQPPPKLGLHAPEMGKVFGLFCMAINMSGLPAISLPIHWTADGLPVGVQVVAAYGREDILLQVARQFEEAFPWSKHWPKLSPS